MKRKLFNIKTVIALVLLCALVLFFCLWWTRIKDDEQIYIEFTLPDENLGFMVTVNNNLTQTNRTHKQVGFAANNGDSVRISVERYRDITFTASKNYASEIIFFKKTTDGGETSTENGNVEQVTERNITVSLSAQTKDGKAIDDAVFYLNGAKVSNTVCLKGEDIFEFSAVSEFYCFDFKQIDTERMESGNSNCTILFTGIEKTYTLKVYAVVPDGKILNYPFFKINGDILSSVSGNGVFCKTFKSTEEGSVEIINDYGIFSAKKKHYSFHNRDIVFKAEKCSNACINFITDKESCIKNVKVKTDNCQLKVISMLKNKIILENYFPDIAINIEFMFENVIFVRQLIISFKVTEYEVLI